jgi:hypothetical protein
MSRRLSPVSGVLAILAAVAVLAAAFLPWLGADPAHPQLAARQVALRDLFKGIHDADPPFRGSAEFVLLICVAALVVGTLTASRFLVLLGALLPALIFIDWLVLEASHLASGNLGAADLRIGAWLTLTGAVLGLLCWAAWRRRSGKS